MIVAAIHNGLAVGTFVVGFLFGALTFALDRRPMSLQCQKVSPEGDRCVKPAGHEAASDAGWQLHCPADGMGHAWGDLS